MILRRILIIILAVIIISLVGAGLLLYGNRENNVNIYNSQKESNIYKSEEENIVLEETTILAENKTEEVQREEQVQKVDIDVSKNNNEVQSNIVTTKENKVINVITTQMDKTINVVTLQPN